MDGIKEGVRWYDVPNALNVVKLGGELAFIVPDGAKHTRYWALLSLGLTVVV